MAQHMKSANINVPIKLIQQFTRLAPWLLLLSVLFLMLATFSILAFVWDFKRSSVMQENRIPYLVVMYGSLVMLSLASAVRSTQAGLELLQLRKTMHDNVLNKAMAYTYDSLIIFLTWLVFLVGLATFLAFTRAF
jgi:hypothetical protein